MIATSSWRETAGSVLINWQVAIPRKCRPSHTIGSSVPNPPDLFLVGTEALECQTSNACVLVRLQLRHAGPASNPQGAIATNSPAQTLPVQAVSARRP